jgi:hypothetical protein
MQALSPEKIQVRAYELWEQEGRPDGKADEHWHRAATELSNVSPVAGKKPRKKVAAAAVTAAPVTKAAAPAKKKAAVAAPAELAPKAKKETVKKAN